MLNADRLRDDRGVNGDWRWGECIERLTNGVDATVSTNNGVKRCIELTYELLTYYSANWR